MQEPEAAGDSILGGVTLVHSDNELSVVEYNFDETEFILLVFDERLGGYSDKEEYPVSHGTPRRAAFYMART